MSTRWKLLLVGGAAVSLLTLATAAHAQISANACQAAKVKLAFAHDAAISKCYAKAEGAGVLPDPLCLRKASDKFTGGADPAKGKFEKTEAKHPDDCLTTDDSGVIEDRVHGFVATLALQLDPTLRSMPSPDKCAAGKQKCAGRLVRDLAKCYVGAAKTGVFDAACSAKAHDKFTGGGDPSKGCFEKVEAKGGCRTADDRAAVEKMAGEYVAYLSCELRICTQTAPMPVLTQVNGNLYYSEHAVFIIPGPSQVNWAGDNYDSVYSAANRASYIATLKSLFPDDYAEVVIAANGLSPNLVPRHYNFRRIATGIGLDAITGVAVPNVTQYNLGGSPAAEASFGVLDHEIGHDWSAFVGGLLLNPNGHWAASSTVTGQMAAVYSEDGFTTVKMIRGDPVSGFTWSAMDNSASNETATFSDQDLYLQGLAPTFPSAYLLDSPVYNPDRTVSAASVTEYDHAWLVATYGVRSPSYRTSPKRIRMGVVYVARDAAEVTEAFPGIEKAAAFFTNSEQINIDRARFTVPFLVETKFRASMDALLEDLDGNSTPTISLAGASYVVSTDGSATVPFVATDPDGPPPVVSCVPMAVGCSVSGSSVLVTGQGAGSHFYTIKAQDADGKKSFAHFVVDVI